MFPLFSLLCAYIAANGAPTDRWTIQIDGSFTAGSPAIATGVYALPASVSFVGLPNPAYGYPTLAGESDVVFTPPPTEMSFTNLPFMEILNLHAPLVSVNQSLYVYLVGCDLFGTPYFASVNGGFVSIKMHNFAEIDSNILTVDATSSAAITAFDGSTISANAATTTGGQIRILVADSANLDPSYLTAPAVTVTFLSKASQINGIQSGAATLSSGVTPAIPAVISATSRIIATYNNKRGSLALGSLMAKTTDRVIGTPGSFRIRSLSATGMAVTGDHSSVDWVVIDSA